MLETVENKEAAKDINIGSIDVELAELSLKNNPFDSDKWSKICKITKNVLIANLRRHKDNFNHLGSSLFPIILSNDIPNHNFNDSPNQSPSINLWELNLLEFVALAFINHGHAPLKFKVVDYNRASEYAHRHSGLGTKFAGHGKAFGSLGAGTGPSQRLVPEKGERKGKVLEKFNLKGKNTTWDMPTNCNTIFTLGSIKGDTTEEASKVAERESAANALKNLSYLVQDFQVPAKKDKKNGQNDGFNNPKVKGDDEFVFFDEDSIDSSPNSRKKRYYSSASDSLKCSQFGKFFKVLKDKNAESRLPGGIERP